VPPLPSVKSPVLKRVEELLRARGRAAVLVAVERAESLALEVDPALTYPEDWVVFRVLGENAPGAGGLNAQITGEQLRAGLGPLVERACAAVRLKVEEAGEGSLTATAVCERWNVSRATLNRLRKRGLIGRRVQTDALRASVVFRAEVVQRFEELRADELQRAGEFSRVSDADATRFVAQAEQWRRERGWSLNQAAAALARETGRSHEGVRQVLRRAAAKGAAALREPPPISEDRRRVLYRAWRRGVDLSLMARKVRRSRGAVRRAINMERAERLREVLSSGALAVEVAAAMPKKPAADPLQQLPARTGLAQPSASGVLAFLASARTQGPPIGAEEKVRLSAYHHLRTEAARVIAKLDRLQPSASAVDRAETMLRWAARLKAELVRSQLRLMVDTLTSRLGRPLEELPPAVLVRTLGGAIRVIGEVIDTHDVSKGGRLAAASGLALDRFAMSVTKELAPSPAQARRAVAVIPSTLPMPDWERQLCSWQSVLEPDRRLRPAITAGRVPPQSAGVLAKRHGWDGGPPRTLTELAAELKVTRIRVLVVEQKALAEALRAVRALR